MYFSLTRTGAYDAYFAARLDAGTLSIETGGYHSHRPETVHLSPETLAEVETTIIRFMQELADANLPEARPEDESAWYWQIDCTVGSRKTEVSLSPFHAPAELLASTENLRSRLACLASSTN